jgi:hypothetical protein
MLYKLNKPFMTRIGQFDEGKNTLVVGILERVLLGADPDEYLYMTMGNSPTIYFQKYGVLLKARHTIWVNPEGKRIRITPVREFLMEKEPEIPIPVVIKEPEIRPLSLFA